VACLCPDRNIFPVDHPLRNIIMRVNKDRIKVKPLIIGGLIEAKEKSSYGNDTQENAK
jgi:hypothetical protein